MHYHGLSINTWTFPIARSCCHDLSHCDQQKISEGKSLFHTWDRWIYQRECSRLILHQESLVDFPKCCSHVSSCYHLMSCFPWLLPLHSQTGPLPSCCPQPLLSPRLVLEHVLCHILPGCFGKYHHFSTAPQFCCTSTSLCYISLFSGCWNFRHK